jgi:hypothetical protein
MHMTPLPRPYQDRSPDVWLLDNTALAHSPKTPSRVGADANVWPERFYASEGTLMQPPSIRLERSGANRGSPERVPKPTISMRSRGCDLVTEAVRGCSIPPLAKARGLLGAIR